ncbi:hypothetical protein [Brucella pseudogrignonensis]|uniref:hypothetical protein n=1 Tax=Brucella pseudogrignonensis TaxID=419475 RepID=UPI0038CFDBA3
MTNLTDIPSNEFPLNYEKYCRLREEIRGAASSFAELNTVIGRKIDHELMEAYEKLGQAWETIRNEERREIERKADGISVRAC